jgi:hypothetical protein
MADSAQVTYEKGKLYDLNIADVQPDPRGILGGHNTDYVQYRDFFNLKIFTISITFTNIGNTYGGASWERHQK